MASCNQNCITDFVQHAGNECEFQFKLGGISRIIMVSCNISEEQLNSLLYNEETSETPTLEDWQTLSDSGYVRITGEIVGSLSEPDVASTAVSSCRPEQAHTRTYTMSFMDYSTTIDGQEHSFYLNLCRYYKNYIFFFVTCDEEIFYAPNPSINANIVIPETNTELRHYAGTISYRVDCMPRPYVLEGVTRLLEQGNENSPEFLEPDEIEGINDACGAEALITTVDVYNRIVISETISNNTPNPQDKFISYPFWGAYGEDLAETGSYINTDSGVPIGTYTHDSVADSAVNGLTQRQEEQLKQVFGSWETFDYEYFFDTIYSQNTTGEVLPAIFEPSIGSTTYVFKAISRTNDNPSFLSVFNFDGEESFLRIWQVSDRDNFPSIQLADGNDLLLPADTPVYSWNKNNQESYAEHITGINAGGCVTCSGAGQDPITEEPPLDTSEYGISCLTGHCEMTLLDIGRNSYSPSSETSNYETRRILYDFAGAITPPEYFGQPNTVYYIDPNNEFNSYAFAISENNTNDYNYPYVDSLVYSDNVIESVDYGIDNIYTYSVYVGVGRNEISETDSATGTFIEMNGASATYLIARAEPKNGYLGSDLFQDGRIARAALFLNNLNGQSNGANIQSPRFENAPVGMLYTTTNPNQELNIDQSQIGITILPNVTNGDYEVRFVALDPQTLTIFNWNPDTGGVSPINDLSTCVIC